MGAIVRSLVPALLCCWPAATPAQTGERTFKLEPLLPRGCAGSGTGDEVVVCGRAEPDTRYRLPLPSERAPSVIRDGVPGGMAALTPTGACGIFAGQRRCSKAEASAYGYGDGRDPVSVAGKLLTLLADPDAEVGTPSRYPAP